MKYKRKDAYLKIMAFVFVLFICLPIFAFPVYAADEKGAAAISLKDGEYEINVDFGGGSGRASVISPAKLIVKDGLAFAQIEWRSSNYDYMIVGEEKYLPINEDGNAAFEIPILVFDEAMTVIGDTTAMSVPHEVEYTLTFHSDNLPLNDNKDETKNKSFSLLAGGIFVLIIVFIAAFFYGIAIGKKKKKKKTNFLLFFIIVAFTSILASGCGKLDQNSKESPKEESLNESLSKESKKDVKKTESFDNISDISGKKKQDFDKNISASLKLSHSMELHYAERFSVDYYDGGYSLLTIDKTDRYLLVPEGKEVPSDLAEDIIILQKPIQNIYLVASAVVDMFVSMDALDEIHFSALQAESWYIDEVKKAMEEGKISYAGKYSTPDYEQIISGKCGLAIENTMIYHTPEVKEQLEKFKIPVIIDYSSYETEPLGRTEWVKLYGLLIGKEKEAQEAFKEQEIAFTEISKKEKTGKTVAFFYITTNGEANVRKSSDYLAKMISMAGGNYIFSDLGDKDDTASSTMSMQMEKFYASAKDADYIIYNSTIEGELSTVEELLQKSSLLEKFKAVSEGNVYCTTKNLYQSSMELGTIISDIHKILNGEDDDLTYIYKLQENQNR